MRAQLLSAYPNVTFLAGEAVGAAGDPNGSEITLDTGRSARAARIVLATGVADELPDFPGLRERWGKTVIHCPYCHDFEFNGAPLGVLATSPMSFHQAELVPDWGPVTFFTSRQAFRAFLPPVTPRALPHSVAWAVADGVSLHRPSVMQAIAA